MERKTGIWYSFLPTRRTYGTQAAAFFVPSGRLVGRESDRYSFVPSERLVNLAICIPVGFMG